MPPLVLHCEDAIVSRGISSLLCGSKISTGKISQSKRFGPSHEYLICFIYFERFSLYLLVYKSMSQQIYTLLGLLFV